MRLSARRGQIAGWLPRSRSSGVEHSAGAAMALANILSGRGGVLLRSCIVETGSEPLPK
jgi:hypothetical protein